MRIDDCPDCGIECYSEVQESSDKWTVVVLYECSECGPIIKEHDSIHMDRAMEERSGFWWPDE